MFACRSTLKPIEHDGFSPAALRRLTDGRSVLLHRLPFTRAEVTAYRAEEAKRLSISGVQDKISLRLSRGRLIPASTGGAFLLKPIPGFASLRHLEAVPANEHLTLCIAGQVFGIPVPPCALVELADGEPAYLVKRFDRRADGSRIPQEDFCQLSNRSEANQGHNYKYDGTLEETGRILRAFCPAYSVLIEDLFRRHVFNYVFSNGDAHLKNFSLLQTELGDHVLSPAYDLLCTGLHLPNESRCALEFFDDTETEFHARNGFYGRPDFLLLARRYGMDPAVAAMILDDFARRAPRVEHLVARSFLAPDVRREYVERMADRLLAIR